MQSWKVIERRDVFSIPGRISVAVETVELPDGRIVDDYMQLQAPDFVLIFAETEADEIICLRQYRHGTRRVALELPAGRIEDPEPALEAARRELLEETGYQSSDWQSLGAFFQSTSHRLGVGHVFRARNAVKLQEPCSGDLEEAEVALVTHEELRAALRRSDIISASSLAALALVLI